MDDKTTADLISCPTGKRADILKDLAAIDDEILDTIMVMIRSIAENCRKKHASRERPAG